MKKNIFILAIIALSISATLFAQNSNKVMKVKEEMPRFPACENQKGDIKTKQSCAEKEMMIWIYRAFKSPVNFVAGEIILSFEVDKKGNLLNPIITKSINPEYDRETLRVFAQMAALPTKWIPGKRNGIPISVFYNISIPIFRTYH